MFASLTTNIVTVPGEQPVMVTIHKLSGKDHDAAQFAHMSGVMTGRGRNWAQRFMQLAASGRASEADANRILADPLSGYDRLTLAKCGIVGWSCVDAAGQPVPVTEKAIDDLEDEPLELLASEILKLTKPGLFQTPAEAEAAQKND